MIKKYLECGKIVSTHGIRGELKVQPWCDGPEFLCGFDCIYLGEAREAIRVESARTIKNMVLLKLAGIDTIDAAVTLRGKIVYIDREDAPPNAEGEFFIQDLMGLEVRDADSAKVYGKLSDVFATGANDVYEITTDSGKKLYCPVIKQVIVKTDLEGGVIEIRPLEGLFDAD